ncbi:MAG: zinc-ribbon domain-containing protein, partial [Dechloromonas sp.]|nr:zinc-ribbon domain-containing protein [Dechloromonas sp.]
MRTRCPACDTIFRVTSEQLRMKAGKVRCGQCQHVFNAFDYLLPDASTDAALVKPPAASTNRAV